VTQPRSTFEQNEYELKHSRNDHYINRTRRSYPVQFAVQNNSTTETMERPIVPAGIRVMTILAAEEGPNQYKVCDENPEGMCLKLRLTDASGGFKFVFDDLPMQLGWRAVQLADAVGIKAVGGNLVLMPEELIDRQVAVEVSHYTSKAGKVSAVVKKYLPPDPALLPKSAVASAKRQASPKPTAMPEDDIPF
jgi:hypothetical protein